MLTQNRTPYALGVLVVAGDADTADSYAELLAAHGHAVRTATEAAGALRQVTAEPPDVVLFDLRMPRLDGCEVARLIRERCAGRRKQPLLVAVTGCASEVDRLRTADAGFDLHLLKPVDPGVLIGVLERFRRLLAPTIPSADRDTARAVPC